MHFRRLRVVGLLVLFLCFHEGRVASGLQQDRVPDTVEVRYPCVIFYSSSPAEYDSLITSVPFWFDSLGNRFVATMRGVGPFLNKNGLESISTSATEFVFVNVDTVRISRKPFADLFGTICYAPGKEPLVLKGVTSESNVLQAVIRYFDIR